VPFSSALWTLLKSRLYLGYFIVLCTFLPGNTPVAISGRPYLLLLLVPVFVLQITRARAEAHVLEEHFGNEYRQPKPGSRLAPGAAPLGLCKSEPFGEICAIVSLVAIELPEFPVEYGL
jgi:hypothetical protein